MTELNRNIYSLPGDLVEETPDEALIDSTGHEITDSSSSKLQTETSYVENTINIQGKEIPWSEILDPTAQV